MPTREADKPAAASREAASCCSSWRAWVGLRLACSSVISPSAGLIAAVSLRSQRALAAIFEGGQAAPSPIVGVDFLDDDEGRFQRLAQDIAQKLADALDERGLLFPRHGSDAGPGAFAGDLNIDDGHGLFPFGWRPVSDRRSGR